MRNQNFYFSILVFLSFLNILAWIFVFDLSEAKFLEVNFFDVGQGDAIFIEIPSFSKKRGYQILIDGGPDSTILRKLAKEMPFWDRSIDLVILTHPEKDHIAGLLEVLKNYKIDFILWTGVVKDTFEWKEWQKLIETQRERGAEIFIAQANQRIKFHGSEPCNLERLNTCIFMEVLSPWENLKGQELKDSNNTSIVAKLLFGQNSFLFTGDIYQSREEELIREYSCQNSCRLTILDSDVLKVSHHGSKSSSSENFLKKVKPEIAIISLSKENKYGHPHKELLERLEKFDIKVLRTDKNGNIKIISDGLNFKIKNEKL